MAVLYDPTACRYVNTPSAYDTAVRRRRTCSYFSSLRMISLRAGFSALAEPLVYTCILSLSFYFYSRSVIVIEHVTIVLSICSV